VPLTEGRQGLARVFLHGETGKNEQVYGAKDNCPLDAMKKGTWKNSKKVRPGSSNQRTECLRERTRPRDLFSKSKRQSTTEGKPADLQHTHSNEERAGAQGGANIVEHNHKAVWKLSSPLGE